MSTLLSQGQQGRDLPEGVDVQTGGQRDIPTWQDQDTVCHQD